MTRDQIAQIIRDNLADYGITYYSVEDLNDSIQDGYDEIAVSTEFIEKTIELTMVSNVSYYNLAGLIPDYYRIVYLYLPKTKRYIFPEIERHNVNSQANWEQSFHAPLNFTLHGPSIIGINGRINSIDEKMKISYKAQAPTLVGDTTILINQNYMDLLENYSTADLLEQNQEYTKAVKHWEIYNPTLAEYRNKVQSLSQTDRIFTRA